MTSAEKFRGGGTLMAVSAAVGVVGLAVTYALFAASKTADAQRLVMASYMVAFTFWVGLAVGGIFWVAIFHAAHVRWAVVIRRGLEMIAGATPIFLLLFIPVLVGSKSIFMWLNPPAHLPADEVALLAHKAPYLNMTFFVIRAVIFFGIWIGVSEALLRWSTRQDTEGGTALTAKMRRLGGIAIPFLAIAITWAAFDWLMSIDPFWCSAIFGGYYFAGSFLGAMALLAVVAAFMRSPDQFGGMMTKEHYHNVGKMLFAFTVFWAYVAFAQFMLQWIANLPEQASWWVIREQGHWAPIGWVLIICMFSLPFCVLLSRDVKYHPKALAAIGLWILVFHYVDIYWLIMPSVSPHTFPVSGMEILADIAALVGVGGIALAFAIFRFRGRYTIPVQDPYLADSLRYVNP